jgi:hypothetical protein
MSRLRSEDTLLMLVDAYPESISISCNDGHLPVDCYRGSETNIRRILTPLEQNQEIASVKPLQQQSQQPPPQQQEEEETQK